MKPIATPDPIIAQAVKLFAERGYAETNLPSIAKAANVAVGTIYRHFKGKEDILNTAFTDIMDYFHDSLADAANCNVSDPESTFSGSGAKFTQGECILYHELKLEVFR